MEELTLHILTLYHIYHKTIFQISLLLNINIDDIKTIIQGIEISFNEDDNIFVKY